MDWIALLIALVFAIVCRVSFAKFYIKGKKEEPGYFSKTDSAWPIVLTLLEWFCLAIVAAMILFIVGII